MSWSALSPVRSWVRWPARRFFVAQVFLVGAGVFGVGVWEAALAAEVHTAAQEGNASRVRELIAGEPSLANLADDRGCRPVHFAADGGSVEVIEMLIDAGAALDVIDVDGDTPLHWAAIRGNVPAIGALVERGAPIDARNFHDETPLLYAAKRLRYDAVELLAAKGADLEIPNDYGRTPLLWVTREGGDLRMAKLLLRLGANVNATDRFDSTPINIAAWRGFRALVDLFLDHGAALAPNTPIGEETGRHAIKRGLDRLYAALIDAGMEVDLSGPSNRYRIHDAAQGGSPSIVADLIRRGAPVDGADDYGFTPLHYAAVRGRAEVVRELLDRGADPSARTMSGYSPWNLAEKENRTDVLALLRDRGAPRAPRRFPELTGPYLGQSPPAADEVDCFAPDIVARPWGEHGSVTFSPDGREAFFTAGIVTPDSGYSYGTIWTTRIENGRWTEPQAAPFARDRGDDVPFFAPDGERLYFLSDRPIAEGAPGGKENIWVVERKAGGWGEPSPLPPVINEMHQHWQISVAANGNVYFNSRRGEAETEGIYVSRFAQGEYGTPEFLGVQGLSPFIAPDESYLLFTNLTESGTHILVAFPETGGGWSEPIDLTETVDPAFEGVCPMVSPDGEYFFFLARRRVNDVVWTDAGFLDELRRTRGSG